MKLALDASVLLTVFNQEPGAEEWMEVLIQARRQGLLVLCEIVYAEVHRRGGGPALAGGLSRRGRS